MIKKIGKQSTVELTGVPWRGRACWVEEAHTRLIGRHWNGSSRDSQTDEVAGGVRQWYSSKCLTITGSPGGKAPNFNTCQSLECKYPTMGNAMPPT